MKASKIDYLGKEVFVGIDVHKKSYAIAVHCEGKLVKNWSMKASPEQLDVTLHRDFKGAVINSVYEAGFSGFHLHRVLEQAGVRNTVVHPAHIETSSKRVKTDKIDAKKLAEQLESGRLKSIYIPTAEEEDRRALSRGRDWAVGRRTSIGNQLKMKLHSMGVQIPDGKKMSLSFLDWVNGLDITPGHKFAIDELAEAWKEENRRIKRFDKQLEAQAELDSKEEIIRSVPGVGAVSARTISNELGDMSRFRNERALASFTGLTPGEYSSGEHVRRGHITREGPAKIRAMLTEVAWRAVAVDEGLKRYHRKISARIGSKKAIIAVARKMICRIRKCLATETKWKQLSENY